MSDGFYSRQMNCPICSLPFSSLAIRSSALNVKEQESDFHLIYNGVNPLHYSVIVCPACNYAAPAASFKEQIKNVEELARALSQITTKPVRLTGERNISDALQSWQLALQSAQLKKLPSGQMAGIYLSAAWIAREIGDGDLEHSYLQQALNSYLAAYNNEPMPLGNLDGKSVAYLIGELYRRLDQYQEAVTWFNHVISDRRAKPNPRIEKLARQQWQEARLRSSNSTPGETVVQPAVSESLAVKTEDKNHEKRESSRSTQAPKRSRMQMPVHLYNDQIDWLSKVVNKGYDSSKSLITKEEVLRAVIDVFMGMMPLENLPTFFSNEEELREALRVKISQ
ncbi:MAG: DUF2225 domain-containing protein [Chitinophagales bacterium]